MENVIGFPDRTLDIMGDHNNSDAVIPVQFPDDRIKICRHNGIQSGDRFIQKQKLAGGTKRSCQKDTLLLASGKISVASFFQRTKPQKFNVFTGLLMIS